MQTQDFKVVKPLTDLYPFVAWMSVTIEMLWMSGYTQEKVMLIPLK